MIHLKKLVTLVALNVLLVVTLLTPIGAPLSISANGINLALGKSITASSSNGQYVASNAIDGNVSSYWESTNQVFPQWIEIDLGSTIKLSEMKLKLPSSWELRTQQISIQGSTDHTSYTTISPQSSYVFNPVSNNTVTIPLNEASTRYVKINIHSNSGWSAGQLSEIELYGVEFPEQAVVNIPGLIEAENWSAMSGVDIEATADTGGGQNVGWIQAGDWMDYLVNVQQAGQYQVEYRVASPTTTGQIQLRKSNQVLTTKNVPSTGSWQSWQTISTEVQLEAGEQTLRLYASGSDFNINWIKFSLVSTDNSPPTSPTQLALSQTTSSTITLSWNAATDNVGVTSYDIYLNNVLRASVNGTTTSYVDTQHINTTLAYYVIAKDAAGNSSAPSNTVTRQGQSNANETNIALNKTITASSYTHIYTASKANDNDLTTYWEGNGNPSSLTVNLDGNATVSNIVLKLNPSSDWSTRTQTITVESRMQNESAFSTLVPSANYTFNPNTDNSVTIPASTTASEVRIVLSNNSGAPSGQIAEFQIFGIAAPKPDLEITQLMWSPSQLNEAIPFTLSATVKNSGTAVSTPTTIQFYMNNTEVGLAQVKALAIDESVQVSVPIQAKNAGSYVISAKVDEQNVVNELNENNNQYTASSSLTISEVPSSDVVATTSWNPSSPKNGENVTFTVNLKNEGNIATTSGPHQVTVKLNNSLGATLKTLTISHNGVIQPGSSVQLNAGNWQAANGSYQVVTTVSKDNNEIAAKEANNTSSTSLYIGRGANMPFTIIEAEAAGNVTNGTILAPNFNPGDFAGEASGRSAVYLDQTGEYVEFTLSSSANAFVLRNAIAENSSGTISLYANGVKKGTFNVSSKFSYVYATPSTLGELGYNNQSGGGKTAYWLYEDAQLLLNEVLASGTKIKIQKDSGDVPWIYVDMLETENVAPPATNPDPSKYVEVSAQKSIEQALLEFRQDSTKKGIFIPAGEWTLNSKIFLYGRATEIIGAGPWHTKLVAPQNQSNTDIGFNIGSTANGSTIKNLSAWGNYVYRIDGPGKFIDGNGMQQVTVENVWVEHFICLYWGVNSSYNTFKNNRIKNVFADGINMTNGSSYNVIDNNYSRGAGDDAFALFSAIDSGGSYNVGNVYSNLTATNVRRAAAFAVYGGSGNTFENLYGADTLTYPGITISSLSFGYNTLGFGDQDTVFDGVTLDRTGGNFWTSVGADDKINEYQNFGAIWFFGGDRTFKNILVKNVDINNPVYYGLMFQTKSPENLAMQNIRVENVNINNPTRYGIKLVVRAEQGQGPVLGSASFSNVKVNNPGVAAIYGENQTPGFSVVRLQGNNW